MWSRSFALICKNWNKCSHFIFRQGRIEYVTFKCQEKHKRIWNHLFWCKVWVWSRWLLVAVVGELIFWPHVIKTIWFFFLFQAADSHQYADKVKELQSDKRTSSGQKKLNFSVITGSDQYIILQCSLSGMRKLTLIITRWLIVKNCFKLASLMVNQWIV